MKKFVVAMMVLICFSLTACTSYEGSSVNASAIGQSLFEKDNDFLKQYYDIYATYFTKEELSLLIDDFKGEYAGVGVYMTKNTDDDYVVIVATMEDYPAAQAGLEAGDFITKVNGKDMKGADTDDLANELRGDEGTTVQVEALRPSTGQVLKVNLKRQIIDSISVEGQFIDGADSIAYLAVYDFNQKTPGEFIDIYNELYGEKPIKGLIIDLRNNGGGSVEAALTMLGYFIPKGETLMYEHFKDKTVESTSKGPGSLNVPVVCLQNNGSASASEIFIGAMKDLEYADTVGEKSFGKGITQLIYQLGNGAGLRFTQSRYLTPSGYDLHDVGIDPQYEVEMKGDDVYKRILAIDPTVDPQLAKAISLLTSEK